MKTHRELYPSQYEHELVGQIVRHKTKPEIEGECTRVVSSRFGKLAHVEGQKNLWGVWDLEPVA